jgi:hypothetical protein
VLDGVLSILQWKDNQQEALDRAESAYTSLVAGRLGANLRELEATDPALAARILKLLGEADGDSLREVVLAPETTSRVLWGHPGRCDDRTLGQYLVELLGAGPAQRNETGLVVDSDSPAAVCFDYSTLRDGGMRLEHYAVPSPRELAIGRLEAAMRGIDAVDAGVASFVRRFTLVANVLVDSETPKFTSGSTSQYIGRSLFCNAHLPGVDVELMADSLVHEAIHSLLYMHEIREEWIDNDVLSRESVVESPWSGATLLVRPFLQACFVWFGLTHFWSLALGGSAFRPERAEARLVMARRGFLNGPLEARIAGYVPHIAPPLLEMVRTMQATVAAGAGADLARG